MSTNYYAQEICLCCGEQKSLLHIGKSSRGWSFCWHGVNSLNSRKDWILFLQQDHVRIIDEYEQEVEKEVFIDKISNDEYRKTKEKELLPLLKHPFNYGYYDKEGCRFLTVEFC